MDGWTDAAFGPLNAALYDARSDPGTTEAEVTFLTREAKGGRVLEFAVGTGRLALPLAATGLDVTGLEISPEMVAKLREKPGGADLPVVIGDMAQTRVEGQFDLVILVFNTLFNVVTQAGQVAVFRNAARHLKPGGRFVVETFVPDLSRFRDHQDVRVKAMELNLLALDALQYDPVTQTLSHQRLWIEGDRFELVPLVLRYAYPPELDLMAELAGLRLQDRWGGWAREAFDAASRMHVSVWEKDADGGG